MNKRLGVIFVSIFPVLVIICFIFADDIVKIAEIFLWQCFFHKITGYWCPGCGNTRSVIAFLHLNIILSLRQNATIPFFALVIFIVYIEALFTVLGKNKKILPRKLSFWIVVIILFFAYFIIRNFIPEIAPV